MHANRSACNFEAQSPTKMESTQASSNREDNVRALADHIVCEEHMAIEKYQMRAERAVITRQVSLSDAIVSISGLIEDTVFDLVNIESQSGVKTAYRRLLDML